jgi:hypothetical protein
MTLKTRLAEPGCLMSVHVCVIPSAVVTQAIAAVVPMPSSSIKNMGRSGSRRFTPYRGNAGNPLRSLGSRAGDQ